MAIRFYKFLIVLGSVFLAKKDFGQQLASTGALAQVHASSFSLPLYMPVVLTQGAVPFTQQWRDPSLESGSRATAIVSRDHYSKNLSFFCRQELKFEKAVKIPLRIRMGSLEQCNKIEGK